MDQGQSKLSSGIEQGERTLSNTNEAGCADIREQVDVYKADYERLRASLAEAMADLDTNVTAWSTFHTSHAQLAAWVAETEAKLGADTPKADLAQKKVQMEKAKVWATLLLQLFKQAVP